MESKDVNFESERVKIKAQAAQPSATDDLSNIVDFEAEREARQDSDNVITNAKKALKSQIEGESIVFSFTGSDRDRTIMLEIVQTAVESIPADYGEAGDTTLDLDKYAYDVAHSLRNFFGEEDQGAKEIFVKWCDPTNKNQSRTDKANAIWEEELDSFRKRVTINKIFDLARDPNLIDLDSLKVAHPHALHDTLKAAEADGGLLFTPENIEKMATLKRWADYEWRKFDQALTNTNIREKKRIRNKVGELYAAKYPNVSDNKINVVTAQEGLEYMNGHHAIVNTAPTNGQVAFLDRGAEGEFIYKTDRSMKMMYSNRFVRTTTGDAVPLFDWWIKQSNCRRYHATIYAPGEAPEVLKDGKLCLNRWRGFAVKPKKGDWKNNLGHWYRIIADKDSNMFRYIVRWQAWKCQNPRIRAEVSIVMRGLKGTGKGLFADQFLTIWGKHGSHFDRKDQLVGDFTGHLVDKSFLYLDEAYFPGDPKIDGAVKNIHTGETLNIRAMRQENRDVPNTLGIIMASNSDWIITATEDERRYVVTDINNKYAKNKCNEEVRKAYFTSRYREMANGGREAMLYDLLGMRLGDFHPRYSMPKNDALQAQIDLNRSIEEDAILDALKSGEFPAGGANIQDKNGYKRYFVSTEAVTAYVNTNYGHRIKTAPKKLSKWLIPLGCLSGKNEKQTKRGWLFPELGEMREKYNERFSVLWEEDKDKDWRAAKWTVNEGDY